MTHHVPDFEALYVRDPDPWQVGSSWYEQRKLSIVLASLPKPPVPLRLGARLWAGDRVCGVVPAGGGASGH